MASKLRAALSTLFDRLGLGLGNDLSDLPGDSYMTLPAAEHMYIRELRVLDDFAHALKAPAGEKKDLTDWMSAHDILQVDPAALELVKDYALWRDYQDDLCRMGVEEDLESALAVLIRRINGEKDLASAGEWVRLNYPRLADKINAG